MPHILKMRTPSGFSERFYEDLSPILPGKFLEQANHFTWFRVPSGFEFGVDQLSVYAYFVPASTGRNQAHTFYLGFKIL
jgi:hypothetical protein